MKKRYLILALLVFFFTFGYCQSPTINPGPGNVTWCPGEMTDYQAVTTGAQQTGCAYKWTVTKGRFHNSIDNTQTVTVIWDDVADKGTLTVTLSKCTEATNTTISAEYAIRSLAGRVPTNARASQTLPYCTSAGITLNVDAMFLQNTGGTTGIPQQRADGYEWTLPTGWTSSGSGGTVSTASEVINITPDNGCRGGSVTVKAFISSCNSGRKYSASATIPVNRIAVSQTLTVPSGYTGPTCGNKAPVRFTAASFPCGQGYRWVFPSNWKYYAPGSTEGSVAPQLTTANYIDLTPKGNKDDDGFISVEIDLGCQTLTQTYHAIYSDPALSRPIFPNFAMTTICSAGTLPVSVNPVAGATSYSWYATTDSYFNINASDAIVWINDVLTNGTAPVTTTSNSVTLKVPAFSGSVRYNIRLFVRANNNGCAGSDFANKDFWAGAPLQAHTSTVYIPGFRGQNPITLSPEALYNIQIDDVPGAVSYRWELPSGFSFFDGFGTTGSMIKVWTAARGGSYYVQCYPVGICGSDGTGNSSLNIRIPGTGPGGGGGLPCPRPPCSVPQPASVYPNPSSDKLTVLTGANAAETEVVLYNSVQENVYSVTTSDESIEIDTRNIPEGVYYLQITNQEARKTERIKINK